MYEIVYTQRSFTVVRRFSFLIIILALTLTVSSASQAQDPAPTLSPEQADPSVVLYSQRGDIIARDTWSGDTINFTEDIDDFASQPMWSGNGEFIVYEVELGTSNEQFPVPYIVELATMETASISRCELGDVVCAATQISPNGDWIAVFAYRFSDGYPIFYMYNVEDKSMEVVQSGNFDMSAAGNRWLDDNRYALVGPFIENGRVQRRIYEAPDFTYTSDREIGAPSQTYLGCNSEVATSVFRNEARAIDIDYLGNVVLSLPQSILARDNPWRNCTAGQLP